MKQRNFNNRIVRSSINTKNLLRTGGLGDYLFSLLADTAANAKKWHPQGMFDTSIEYKCMKGISGFKIEVLRKFVKKETPQHYARKPLDEPIS